VTGQWSLLHVQVDRYTLRHEVHPLSVPSEVGADREDIVKEWLT